MRGARDRRGVALLTVLLLVAVIAVIAVAVLDDVRFSIRRTVNVESGGQARWYALGAESLARRQIVRLNEADPARTPVEPQWNGRVFAFPIEGGSIRASIGDGQACLNLNSVAEGLGDTFQRRPLGVAQFLTLARTVGVPESQARQIVEALADWIDADAAPGPGGGEDSLYAASRPAYRTGGTLLAEVSELRAVRGVDAAAYRRLRPYVCALPISDLSPINVNTLSRDQAPLLVMLTEGRLSLDAARRVIAATPPGGWSDIDAFWSQPALRTLERLPETSDQVTVRTRYFTFRADVEFGGAHVVRTALLEQRSDGRVRTVAQRWTPEE